MRVVEWKDADGYLHRSLLRDSDPDHLASSGIPLDPPDIDRLDWEGIKRDLHNVLVKQGLSTWQDVLDSQGGIVTSIVSALKRPLIDLYKQHNIAAKSGGTDG